MLNNADETAFDRLTAFAAEANDYTIRAAQFRPDVAALLITIEQLEAEIARKDAALNQIAGWAEPNSSIWRVANDARALLKGQGK